VAVNYSSDREGAERVAQAIIDSGGEAIPVRADVSKAANREDVVTVCSSRHLDAEATGRHALAINQQPTSAKNAVKTALLLPSPRRDVWRGMTSR
jgi:monoamine oxidase